MCSSPSSSRSENVRGWVPDKLQTGTQVTPHPHPRPAHSRPHRRAVPPTGDQNVGTREARVAGRLALAGSLQRAIPGLKVNVQSPRALDGSGEAAATGLDGVGWVSGGGQVAGPAGPAGGRGGGRRARGPE